MLTLILVFLEAPTPSQPSSILYLGGTSHAYLKVQLWQIRIWMDDANIPQFQSSSFLVSQL
jgi:hypothetical protein